MSIQKGVESVTRDFLQSYTTSLSGLTRLHLFKKQVTPRCHQCHHRTPIEEKWSGAESINAIPRKEKMVGASHARRFSSHWKKGCGGVPRNALYCRGERRISNRRKPAEGAWHPILISNRRKMDFAQNRRFLPLDYKTPADDINASENGKFCHVLMLRCLNQIKYTKRLCFILFKTNRDSMFYMI